MPTILTTAARKACAPDWGKTLRENGAKPNDFEFKFNLDTGPNYRSSVHYEQWLKGFRAGYYGERKPRL
jgi:hypothetical protein